MARPIEQTIYFVLLIFGLPFFGWLIGHGVAASAQEQILSWPAVQTRGVDDARTYRACADPELPSSPRAICTTYKASTLFRDAAFYSMLGALALLAVVWITARLGRNNPALLAALFGIEVRVVCLYLCGLTLVQGVFATAAVALIAAAAGNNAPLPLLGAFAAATLAGGYQMVRVAFRIVRPVRTHTRAVEATRAAQPRLWAFVDDLSQKLGVKPPKNLLLGLEPVFCATAAEVVLLSSPSKALSGETLCLSLPFMRILSPLELAAVIGHELGHLKSRDTVYTLRFLPIYLGLGAGITSIHAHRNILSRVALYPALALLSFCHEQFQMAERSIARDGEFAADSAGALASNGSAVVTALVKASAFEPSWQAIVQQTIASLSEGKPAANMSTAFEREVRQRQAGSESTVLLANVVASHQPHPTDTHPTLEARAAALGVSVAGACIFMDGGMSIALVEDAEAIENVLTGQLEQMFLEDGIAKPPTAAAAPETSLAGTILAGANVPAEA